jgi:hypothetical protein
VRVARVLLQNPLCLFVGFEAGTVQVGIYLATAIPRAARRLQHVSQWLACQTVTRMNEEAPGILRANR